jgi:glycosyltransferase involved in cell wall biosynthesis
MKISVITVSFNNADVIGRTLDSVEAQTHDNFEHIVIDGGSTDGTVDILRARGSKLGYWISETDAGIYDAMNKGLAVARGDIICFLNADDYYISSEVLSLVAREMSSKNLDIFYGDVAFFKKNDCQKIIRRYRSGWFRPDRIAAGWMPAHPASFVRSEIFKQIGGFDKRYRIAGDFEFIVRLFSKKNLRYEYLPEVFVQMQIGGISTRGWKSKLQLNREILEACRSNGIKSNWLRILSKYPLKLSEIFFK